MGESSLAHTLLLTLNTDDLAPIAALREQVAGDHTRVKGAVFAVDGGHFGYESGERRAGRADREAGKGVSTGSGRLVGAYILSGCC